MQFDMTSGGERVSFTTHASKFPSGKNANFAERKVRTVLLPEDPLFAPQLCIRVGIDRLRAVLVYPLTREWNGSGQGWNVFFVAPFAPFGAPTYKRAEREREREREKTNAAFVV